MDTILSKDYKPKIRVNDLLSNNDLREFENILSKKECVNLINYTEKIGYVRASLYVDHKGNEVFDDSRISERVIIDSDEFTNILFDRLKPYLEHLIKYNKIVKINRRLRFLKYTPGGYFEAHRDSCYFDVKSKTRSIITILIYLNEDYEGGFTHVFTEETNWFAIQPKIGKLILQHQSVLHQVPKLQKGIKYAIRTEIMVG